MEERVGEGCGGKKEREIGEKDSATDAMRDGNNE